ncbi:unnamed protein product [Paramecium octaurelia]|uniref:Uncharacterized protein n=1 Tax=Paramecium octaurelia TaxID=43137 RepID=A0A8S1TQH1_PAROT|nr:unnamed protein product [Paramecium octaurelia]
MNNNQSQFRIQTRSVSAERIMIILQSLDQVVPQLQQKTMRIDNATTFLDIKQVIQSSLETQENIELYFQMDQPYTGNLNELALNKIKQDKIKTIYYKNIRRNSDISPHKIIRKPQEQRAQLNERSPNYKNLVSPNQNRIQFENPERNNNNQRIILNRYKNSQFMRNSQDLGKVQQAEFQKQSQEWVNEKKLLLKQLRMNSLKMQDLEQENTSLSLFNKKLSDELALLKQNFSEFENLQLENNLIKDEIDKAKLCHQQMLMENSQLKEQNSQLLKELHNLNSLQQENQRLIQIINDSREKANQNSQNQIQRPNYFKIISIDDGNSLQDLEQQQNQQQIQNLAQMLKKNIPSNLDSQNNNLINICGHAISSQQLAEIIVKAFFNKRKALCNQCSQPLTSKLCLQDQSLGRNYIEEQNKSDCSKLINFIYQKINSHSQSLAKCKNQNCNFFCIWQHDQQNQQERNFCSICLKQSVINPFLPDQVLQEISQRL